jgi:hypothetical protein
MSSRDSAVGIATGYGLDDRRVGVGIPVGKNFHFSMSSRRAMGSTEPRIQGITGSLSPGVKRPGCEADHSLPAREVKKTRIYISTPLYAFMT